MWSRNSANSPDSTLSSTPALDDGANGTAAGPSARPSDSPGTTSYENRPPPPVPVQQGAPQYASNYNNAGVTPEEFRAIVAMSKEELEDMMNSEAVFEQFFESLERVKHLKQVGDEFWTANETAAKRTLAREQELVQLREAVQNQTEALKNEYAALEQKLQIQHKILERFSPAHLISKLKDEARTYEELSEQMEKSFLEGEIEVDVFLKNFQEMRKVCHLRNAKIERVRNQPDILGPSA